MSERARATAVEVRGRGPGAGDAPTLFRICTLPADAIDDLMLPEAAAGVRRAVAIESALGRDRDRLSAALAAAVPAAGDRVVRRTLLDVRRRAFTFKTLPPDTLARVRPVLDAPTASLLDDYVRGIEAYRSTLADIDRHVERELPGSLERLRAWVSVPHFRAGVALASPPFAREVSRYFEGDYRDDGLLAGLMRYLVRTCVKTSPFSTFTAVGQARWGTADGMVTTEGTATGVAASFTHLSVQWLFALEHIVVKEAALRRHLPVRVNSSVVVHNGRIEFVRRQLSKRSLKLAANSETVVSMAATPLTETLAAYAGLPPRSSDECVAQIVASSGGRLSAEVATEVLTKLIDNGLLCAGFEMPTTVQDLWTHCRNQVPETDEFVFRELRAMMTSASAIAAEVASADAARRLELFDGITRLQRGFAGLAGATVLDGEPPRQFVFEDSRSALALTCGREAWQPHLEDLRACAQIYLLCDRAIPSQYDMAAEFVHRYGPDHSCATFHEFYRDFLIARQRRLARDGQFPSQAGDALDLHPNTYQSREIALVNGMRTRLAALLRGGPHEETALTPETVDALLEDLHYPYRDHLRAAVFTMAAAEADGRGARLAVNMCALGFGKYVSRFCWLLDAAPDEAGAAVLSEAVRRRNRVGLPDDTVLAEVMGLFGAFSVDSHPPLTDYQIEYPGESTTRPSSEVIALKDLSVRYNPATRLLELFAASIGKKVWPVHLGFLTDLQLPPVFRALLEFAPPLSNAVGRPTTWRKASIGGMDILHAPRVRIGSALLAREEWGIRTSDLPFALKGVDFWLEMQRLRVRLGLPTEVFRRSDLFAQFMADNFRLIAARAADPEAPVEPAPTIIPDGTGMPFVGYRDDARKPMFMSFDSYHLVDAFRRSAAMQGKYVIVSEVFPPRQASCVRHDGSPYAAEFLVELDGF